MSFFAQTKRFLTLLLLACLLSTFAAAQSVSISSLSSDLNVCGVQDTFQIILSNATSNPLDSILVTVNFHNGVSYQNGSLTGTGYTERDVTNPDSVSFFAPGLAPFGSDTLLFTAAAGCAAIDSSAITNLISVNYLQGNDVAASAPYVILLPALSVQNIAPASFTGPVGATFSRCVSVINGGFGSLSRFSVVIERDPATLSYTNFTLAANSSTLTPSIISGDSIVFEIGPAEIQALGDLDTLLEQNEVVEICFDVELVDCINLGSLVSAYWGCGGSICERQASSANIIVPTLVPLLVTQDYFFENRCYGDSTPSISKIVIQNNGAGAARNVEVAVWQGGGNGPGGGYISRFDTSTIELVDTMGNVQNMTPYGVRFQQNTGLYACLGPAPVMSFKVLIPLLEPGARDTLVFRQYSCCKTWCNTGPSLVHRSYFKIDYNDQCFTNSYTTATNGISGSNYGRIVNFTANGPPDVNQGDTAAYCLEISNFRYYNIVPGAYMYVDLVVPPGLTVVNGPGCTYMEDVQGDLWNPSGSMIMGDTVRTFFDLPRPGNFSLEKSNFKFKLTTDCSLGPCVSGPKTVRAQFYQVPDTSCACTTTLGCHSFITNAHCGICPATCQDGGMLFLGFDAYRLNYGLPDNDNNGVPDTSGVIDMSRVRTQHLMLRDTLFTQFRGIVDTTAANPFWVDGYARSTITRGSNLSPVSHQVRIVDASTNNVYTCVLPAPTITGSGTIRTYTYALDTATLAGCVPPGFVYEINDSVEVTAIYVVSTNPGNFLQAQTIENEFVTQTPGGGLVAGCDDYSGAFILVGYYHTGAGFNHFRTTGCNPVTISENYYLSIGNCCSNYAGGNMFKYEYRHWGIPLRGRVVIPPGYTVLNANVSHYMTSGTQVVSSILTNPFPPTNVVGDTLFFDLSSQFTSNGGTVPLGDDGYYGRLQVRLLPSCGVPSEVSSVVRYFWDFDPIPNLTGPGAYTTAISRRDSVFYKGHSLAVYPALPNAPGIGSSVNWEFTIENGSNNSAVDSTWFALVSPSGLVVPTSVVDVVSNDTLSDVNGIYRIGPLPTGGLRRFRVEANYANCEVDSLQIISGGDCNDYPVNLAAYTCNTATAWLYIEPQPSALQASVTLAPGPHDICDSLQVELEVVSSQLANIRDIGVSVRLPLTGGLTWVPGSGEMLYPAAGSYTAIPDPVVAGNTFSWDINSINAVIAANDLPGTVVSDSNSFKLRFYLYTNCNMISGDRIRFRVEGDRSCGTTLPLVLLISDPVNISGAVQPYTTQIRAQSAQNAACPINQTLTIEVVNTGLGTTTAGDSMFVDLSPGYTYLGNFSGQVNAPSNGNPTLLSGPGGVRLGWESPAGISPGDTIRFSFDVEIGDAVPCGPDPINVQTVTNQVLFCARTSSNCNAATQTGSFALNVNVQRPNLSFTGFTSTIQPIGGGYDYNYTGTIQNSGLDILGGTTTAIEFYCDSDQSGGYSPGDTPLGTYSTTNGITGAMPHNFSGNLFIPTGACSDTNMIYGMIVPNSSAGYCLCDTALGNSNVVLPVEWLSLTGKVQESANALNWTVRMLPTHHFFLVERQTANGWEVISPRITTRQSRYIWLDQRPSLRESYRIRATDLNGERTYSPTVELVRADMLDAVRVYPNPGHTKVFLEAASGTKFRLFNAFGQMVIEGEVGGQAPEVVDISGLANGVYLVEFNKKNGQQTVRLVIE